MELLLNAELLRNSTKIKVTANDCQIKIHQAQITRRRSLKIIAHSCRNGACAAVKVDNNA